MTEPSYVGLDHVQLTIPPGTEGAAREFFSGVLRMPEVEKPESLRGRGGLWLRIGTHEIHLGIEEAGPPSRRHPAIIVDALAPLRERLSLAGIDTTVYHQTPDRPGFNRIEFRDPFGNRLEFMERAE